MNLEIFAICDSAADYGGRLTIMGAFEGIASESLPAVHERCSVVARMRFPMEEEGAHAISVRVVDAEGSQIMPEMNAGLTVKIPRERKSAGINIVLNLNRLKFEKFGEYGVEFHVDELLRARLPLMVARRGRATRRPSSGN